MKGSSRTTLLLPSLVREKSPSPTLGHNVPSNEARARVLSLYESEVRPSLLQKGNVSDEVLGRLAQELVFLFIGAFQDDTMQSWKTLVETLLQIQPVTSRLQHFPQIKHYIKKVQFHASTRTDKVFLMKILQIMMRLFPQVTTDCTISSPTKSRISVRPDPPASLSVSPSSVIVDYRSKSRSPQRSPNRLPPPPPVPTSPATVPKTGLEVAQYLLSADSSPSLPRFFYLVKKGGINPYDLTVVSRPKGKEDHYIFSRNGVIHVGFDESCALSEWLREARLFASIHALPTFKTFLVGIAFRRWKNFTSSSQLQRRRYCLSKKLIASVPELVFILLQLLRAVNSISELLLFAPQESPKDVSEFAASVQQTSAAIKPLLYKSVMEIQFALAMARRKVLSSFNVYRNFRKHPALRKKQSLYLAKEDTMRRKALLELADFVEQMHRLAFQQTASHIDLLFERTFSLFPGSEPTFLASLALHYLPEDIEIVLEADFGQIRDSLLVVIRSLTDMISETLLESEIKNKHNLMFGGSAESGLAIGYIPLEDALNVGLPACFATFHTFMPTLSKQLSSGGFLKKMQKKVEDTINEAEQSIWKFVGERSPIKAVCNFLQNKSSSQSAPDAAQTLALKVIEWKLKLALVPDAFTSQPPLLRISCAKCRVELHEMLQKLVGATATQAAALVGKMAPPLLDKIDKTAQMLNSPELTWRGYMTYTAKHIQAQQKVDVIKQEMIQLENQFMIICSLQSDLVNEDAKLHDALHASWSKLSAALTSAKQFLENNSAQALDCIESEYHNGVEKLLAMVGEVSEGVYVDPDADAERVFFSFNQFAQDFDSVSAVCNEISLWYGQYCKVRLKSADIESLRRQFSARGRLWHRYHETLRCQEGWLDGATSKDVVTSVEKQVEEWLATKILIEENLPPDDPVYERWLQTVNKWHDTLPLLSNLLPLDAEVWKVLSKSLGYKDAPQLRILLEEEEEHRNWILTTTSRLERRNASHAVLQQIRSFWAQARFSLTGGEMGRASPWNENPLPVTNIDSLNSVLQDHQLQLQVFESMHMTSIDLSVWLSFLCKTHQLLLLWDECCSMWLLLKKYQTVVPANNFGESFAALTTNYKDLIGYAARHPFIACHIPIPEEGTREEFLHSWKSAHPQPVQYVPCSSNDKPNLSARLSSLLQQEKDLMAKLESVLLNECDIFPRLYLLSQSEHLSFQTQAVKDFPSIYTSPYIQNCFPAASHLTLHREKMGSHQSGPSVLHIHSREESLPLLQAPPTSVSLAHWLSAVQHSVRQSLKLALRQCLLELWTASADLLQLAADSYPTQCLLMASATWWAKETASLDNHKKLRPQLETLKSKLSDKLQQCRKSNQKLSPISGLIYQLDYYLGLLEAPGNLDMAIKYIPQAFQLSAPHAESVPSEVSLSCGNDIYQYGYEYIGPSVSHTLAPLLQKSSFLFSKMVRGFTGLSDLSSWSGLAVENLAKLLGRAYFQVKCSPDLTLKRLLHSLMGVMLDGSWLLVDKINCLNSGDLSAFGEHIRHINQWLQLADFKARDHPGEGSIGLLPFCGRALPLHTGFQGFLALPSDSAVLPSSIQSQVKDVALVQPDIQMLFEAWLRVGGFTHIPPVAGQLIKSIPPQVLSFRLLRSLAASSIDNLDRSDDKSESLALKRAVQSCLVPCLPASHLLREVFPDLSLAYDNHFQPALEEVMGHMGLQPAKELLNKAMQVYEVLQNHPLVVCVGPGGSGKSACLRVVFGAMNLYSGCSGGQSEQWCTCVEVDSVCPSGMTDEQFSAWCGQSSTYSSAPHPTQLWRVCDGDLREPWWNSQALQRLSISVLRKWEGQYTGQSMHLLVECPEIDFLDPSALCDWSVVHLGPETLSWQQIATGWLDVLSSSFLLTLADAEKVGTWILQSCPPLITWLLDQLHPNDTLTVWPNYWISAFFHVLRALLTSSKSPDTISAGNRLRTAFDYCVIWSFGGHLDRLIRDKFESQAKSVLPSCRDFPETPSLFLYTLDSGQWKVPSSQQSESNILPECTGLLSLLVQCRVPVLITGNYGSGKSHLLKHLKKIHKDRALSLAGSWSLPHMSCAVEKQLLPGKQRLLLVDDLNIASQPVQEKLRDWLNNKRLIPIGTANCSVSRRLTNQCVLLCLSPLDFATVYQKQLEKWLTLFRSFKNTPLLAKKLIVAAEQIHNQLKEANAFTPNSLHRVMESLVAVDKLDVCKDTYSSLLAHWAVTVVNHYSAAGKCLWEHLENSLWKNLWQTRQEFSANRNLPIVYHVQQGRDASTPSSVLSISSDRRFQKSLKDQANFRQLLDLVRTSLFFPHHDGKHLKYLVLSDQNELPDSLVKQSEANPFIQIPDLNKKVVQISHLMSVSGGHVLLSSNDCWVGKKTAVALAAKQLRHHLVRVVSSADCWAPKTDRDVDWTLLLESDWTLLHRTSPLHRSNWWNAKHAVVQSVASKWHHLVETVAKKDDKEEDKVEKDDLVNLEHSVIEAKLQECLHRAGVKGQPVLLLVSLEGNGGDSNDHIWLLETIQSLVLHGDCEWLRSLWHAEKMTHYMQLIFWQQDRNAFPYHKFLDRVLKNLHIAICIRKPVSLLVDSYLNSLRPHLSVLSDFQPWTSEEWTQLLKKSLGPTVNGKEIPSEVFVSLSSVDHRLTHPTVVTRRGQWFKLIHPQLCLYQESQEARAKSGLKRLSELKEEALKIRSEMAPLDTRKAEIEEQLRNSKEKHSQSRARAKLLEDECSEMKTESQSLKGETETARERIAHQLEEAEPLYNTALNQLLSYIPSRLQEVKSYRIHQPLVVKVLDAFSLLCGKPQHWENGKLFLKNEYLPACLHQFDRDAVTTRQYSELQKYVSEPSFSPEVVAQTSEAAGAICNWIHAVNHYLNVKFSNVQLYQELEEAEKKTLALEEELKSKSEELLRFEETAQKDQEQLQRCSNAHDGIVHKLETLESAAHQLERSLVLCSWAQRFWEKQQSSRGDLWQQATELALLLSPARAHHGTPLTTPKPFYLQEEDRNWMKWQGVPEDPRSVESFLSLFLHLTQGWSYPVLVLDQNSLLTKWLAVALQVGHLDVADDGTSQLRDMAILCGDDPSFLTSLPEKDGSVVNVADCENLTPDKWERLSKYKAFVATSLSFDEIVSRFEGGVPIASFPLVDLNLVDEGLNDLYTSQMLKLVEPELGNKIRLAETEKGQQVSALEQVEKDLHATIMSNIQDSGFLNRVELLHQEWLKRDQQLQSSRRQLLGLRGHKSRYSTASGLVLFCRRLLERFLPDSHHLMDPAEYAVAGSLGPVASFSNLALTHIFTLTGHLLGQEMHAQYVVRVALHVATLNRQVDSLESQILMQELDSQMNEPHSGFEWLSTQMCEKVDRLESAIPALRGLRRNFVENSDQWQAFFKKDLTPMAKAPMQLTPTQTVLIYTAICPQKSSDIYTQYASQVLGMDMSKIRPPADRLQSAYRRSNSATPIYCLCRDYALPRLYQMQREANVSAITTLFVGDARNEPTLEHALRRAVEFGGWVILLNTSSELWTPTLIWRLRLVLSETGHPNFRLWILADQKNAHRLPATLRRSCIPVVL